MRNDFESNYLAHSAKGTTWRKKAAKYLKRLWKNGKWVYYYKITGKGYLKEAENARQKRLTAESARDKSTDAYKKAYAKELEAAKSYKYNSSQVRDALRNYSYWNTVVNSNKSRANKLGYTKDREKAADYLKETTKNKNESYREKENNRKEKESYAHQARESTRVAESHAKKEREAENNYKTKSLAGITESTIKRGQDTINKLLSNLKTTESIVITSNLYPPNTQKVIKKK